MKIHGDGAFVLLNKPHYKAILEVTEMFKNPRYCTKGISETVPLLTQIILWDLIDSMEVAEKTDIVNIPLHIYLKKFEMFCIGINPHGAYRNGDLFQSACWDYAICDRAA